MRRKAFMLSLGMGILLLAMSLVPSPAVAATEQTALTMSTMKISLSPEYDDPRVMVIYQGEFADGSAFPQQVNFPVPMGSEMNMVCALQPPNDDHLCQLYDTQTEANNLDISYKLPIPTYYLEYYWDGIQTQTDKSFDFSYVSPYAIDRLEVDVQQPLRSTDFKLSEQYASATSDGQGFKHYKYVFNNVTPGQTINIDASYTKADNNPSVAKQGTGGTSSSGKGINPYVLMIIGAVIVAAVGFMLFRRKPVAGTVGASGRATMTAPSRRAARAEARHAQTQETRRETGPALSRAAPVQQQRAQRQAVHTPSRAAEPARTTPVPPRPPADTASAGGRASFCTQCGTKLAAGSLFCHACGTKAKAVE